MAAPILSLKLDLSAVSAVGQQLTRAHALIERETEVSMHKVVLKAQHDAVRDAKKDTRTLARSITNKVERVPGGVLGTIGSNAPHAETIEKGRRPGKKMPPPGVLLGWMARHNIPVSENKPHKGARRLKSGTGEVLGFSTRVKKTKGYYPIEFLIARKIGKKGFPGDHNMENAVKGVLPMARTEFAGIGPRVMQRLLRPPH